MVSSSKTSPVYSGYTKDVLFSNKVVNTRNSWCYEKNQQYCDTKPQIQFLFCYCRYDFFIFVKTAFSPMFLFIIFRCYFYFLSSYFIPIYWILVLIVHTFIISISCWETFLMNFHFIHQFSTTSFYDMHLGRSLMKLFKI